MPSTRCSCWVLDCMRVSKAAYLCKSLEVVPGGTRQPGLGREEGIPSSDEHDRFRGARELRGQVQK
jgi:hypothetical protein